MPTTLSQKTAVRIGESPHARRQEGAGATLPLLLSEDEARWVLQSCAAAPPLASPVVERALFEKLGELLRAFWA